MTIIVLALLMCLTASPTLGMDCRGQGRYGCNVCNGEHFQPLDVIDADSDVTNIFDDLTVPAIRRVEKYLLAQEKFDLQDAQTPGLDSAFIYLMETLPPNKQEALDYLDNNGPMPGKYVKAILYRSNLSPPIIEEYKVGPLVGTMTHSLIRQVPWHMRNNIHSKQYAAIEEHLKRILMPINEPMNDVTGYKFSNCTDNCLVTWTSASGDLSDPGNSQKIWINYLKAGFDGYYLHPVGFQLRIDTTSNNPNDWTEDRYWFRGQHFDSLLNLKKYLENNIPNTPPPRDVNNPDMFSTLHRRGEPLTDTPRRGPSTNMPDGRRYHVDGHHVKWQGWEFDFNIRTITGLQAHDIRFKGERIAYEVALSEMSVVYSGENPMTSQNVLFDSNYLFGGETFELIPGLDGPYYADYFDFAHYVYGKPIVYRNSACLFEHDTGVPLRRHYETNFQGSYFFAHGIPDNALVLRTMVTVSNYDYAVDFVFHQNGAFEIKWTLSGYIAASYYTGNSGNRYGYEIAPNIIGPLHSHAAIFKIDLDIKGTSNRFQTLDIKGRFEDNEGDPGNQFWRQHVEENTKQTEKEAVIKYNFEAPRYMLIQNDAARNVFGNPNSYRVYNQFMAHLTYGDDFYDKRPAASWLKHQLAITKHKDEEMNAGDMYMNQDPYKPLFSFQDYIDDNESIVDEDLVVWATVAIHHIPHTENIPITSTPGATGSVLVTPFNYFPEEASMSSTDNVRTVPNKDEQGDHIYQEVSEDLPWCKPDCPPRGNKNRRYY